jgi:BirA family biotin operon repressor/biotin-[acetyl-CoA-carboxylase] ligase
MQLPRSAAVASSLTVLDECGSTNTELVARAAGLDDFAVLVTDNQTSGRGRLGREWTAPPGRMIATSVLLRPVVPGGRALGIEHYGWLPLIAGLAMTRALAPIVPSHRVSLKWPNDVQVDGLKVCGILAELLGAGDAVVMGAGINLTFETAELPVPTATSLSLNDPIIPPGVLADAALSGYLAELRLLLDELLRHGPGNAQILMGELCSTFGRRVRVEVPGGDALFGTAVDVDADGRLRVRVSEDGSIQAVAAGDVTHLRYE